MPAVRAATEGGSTGSGGTGIGSANPPKAPSKGSACYTGGTPESEFGLLIALISGDRPIPGDRDRGKFKRCKVKGVESVVGKTAPTAAEADAAMADPSQMEGMRLKIHNWLYIAFSKVIERHTNLLKIRKQLLLDLLTWRVDFAGLHSEMAIAMTAHPRSEALISMFCTAVHLVCMDLWEVDALPPNHEMVPIADLRSALDYEAAAAPVAAAAGKGKGKAKDEPAAPWQRQQRQRTEGPQDQKGKGKDERTAGKGKDAPPRDQHHDAKGKWGKGRGGDGKGKGDQGNRRGRTDARDQHDDQRGRTRTTPRGQRPTGRDDDQGWW